MSILDIKFSSMRKTKVIQIALGSNLNISNWMLHNDYSADDDLTMGRFMSSSSLIISSTSSIRTWGQGWFWMKLRWIPVSKLSQKNIARPATDIYVVADEVFDWKLLSFENFKTLQVETLSSWCRFNNIIQRDTFLCTLVLTKCFLLQGNIQKETDRNRKKYVMIAWGFVIPAVQNNSLNDSA